MLKNLYSAIGLALSLGLGIAFAAGWQAPDLGLTDGSGSGGSSSTSGRSSYHFSSWHFGK